MSAQGFAQQYLYTDPTIISNTYPLASTANNLRQAIYHPSNFPTAPNGNITAIYLLKENTNAANIVNLTVKLGYTTLQNYPTTSYITTGLQTVYSGNYNQPLVNGNYIKIILQTPFPYDSNQNFVLEISQTATASADAQVKIMQVNNNQVPSRTIFASLNNTTGTKQDRLPVLGLDIATQLGTQEQNFAIQDMIYPNPTSDVLNFKKVEEGSTYKIFNSIGSIIIQGNVKNKKVDVSSLIKGHYIISITEKGKEVINSKFTKN